MPKNKTRRSDKIRERMAQYDAYEKKDGKVISKITNKEMNLNMLRRQYEMVKAKFLRLEELRDEFWPGEELDEIEK